MRHPLTVALLSVLVLCLLVPTSAAAADRIGEDGDVVLSPHSGPNGRHAGYDADGNLTIDVTEALSTNARTVLDDVVEVSNEGTEYVEVWFTYPNPDRVSFHDRSGTITGADNGTVLAPGETASVGLTIDTHGVVPGATIGDNMTVRAEQVSPPPTSTASGGSGGGGGGGGGTADDSTTDETRVGTVVTVGTIRIELDERLRPNETVRVDRSTRLPPDPGGAGVTAAISLEGPKRAPETGSLSAFGADAVVTEGRPAVLSGAGTTVGEARGIDRQLHVVGVYDVSVPPRLRGSSATVLVTVNRSRFEPVDPASALIAHRTDRGWELLETRAATANDTHVALRARTGGFSTFVVFGESDLEYRWEIEERGETRGGRTTVTYEEPGRYNASLAVTDALGRADEATHRLLVNDRPSLSLDVPESIQAGERATLRADVEDRFGETTVEWTFRDGTTVVGQSVTRRFAEGVHVVEVTARDEFGASTSASRRLVVGSGPLVSVVAFALGLEGRIGLVALAALVVLGSFRWLQARGGRRRRRSR